MSVKYRPARSAPPSIMSIRGLFSMNTATWSPRCSPAARRNCATRLQPASYAAKVTVSPEPAMMIAGWSGWSIACWRANKFPPCGAGDLSL